MKVAVCVITYKRPEGLTRLLEGIGALTFREERPDIRVIVVDNDASGSARAVYEGVRPELRLRLEYYVEPRRGIPHARNTAIARAHAGGDVDCVAFIDDDEVPEPNWLEELLRVMNRYQADVVAGPVVPHFMEEAPPWIIKGKFYDRKRWSTGEVLDRAFTGNILFRREVFSEMDAMFDERMALTGGSDSHFLRRVHRAGFKIVWSDEAVVTEWIPASRVGTKWILRRAFRIGTSLAFILLDLRSPLMAVPGLVAAGSFRILKGALLLPVGCAMGPHGAVRQMRQVCYGAGMLAGLFGTRYQEYRRTHGA